MFDKCFFPKFILSLAVTLTLPGAMAQSLAKPEFSAPLASENLLIFDYVFASEFTDVRQLAALGDDERQSFVEENLEPLMKFLFGPATLRDIGSPQRGDSITVKWNAAYLENGHVLLPYHYIGKWILDLEVANSGKFNLPVPRNYKSLFTKGWKLCTDSAPEHATESFFWYFWDPARPGCDHLRGVQYDDVEMQVGIATENQTQTYPEYKRMIRDGKLALTIAFGYVQDPASPHPETDRDAGAYEYRDFLANMRGQPAKFKEEPVYLSEYDNSASRLVIGHRFSGPANGVQTSVTVVMSGAVDQMTLFAKSFAHDHDAVFAWMGHSRVGSGFDAERFQSLVQADPRYYSVTTDYQLVYWGGCNSYSYYTLPFFDFKAQASGGGDPHGTKNLDIIAHGLPSLFSFGANNAEILTKAVLDWPQRTSYQQILKDLENNSSRSGILLLAAVLGDEDNP
ncbi:MAG: hypothetical protein ACXVA9_01880 [Bdellovibrionales bacterium]